jgi:group I intron endonuclease
MVQASDYDWEDSGIYVIRNKINGKEYVGKSKELTKRNSAELSALRNNIFNISKNKKISNHHLQKSFNKYGEENFEFKTIKNNICPGLLGVYEIFEIAKRGLPNHDLGYNYTQGGDGCYGHTQSEESNKKRSEATSGDNHYLNKMTYEEREEHLKKRSESHKGQIPWNKDQKQPQTSGENHPNTDLTINDVRDIKRKILTMTYHGALTDIAAEYDVHIRVISKIKNGHTWKDVKIDEDDD